MTEIQNSQIQPGTEAIRGWLEGTVRALVDVPDAVRVGSLDGEHTTILEVEVAASDVSRVVGRKGRTVDALRAILLSMGGRARRRYIVAVSEPGDRLTEMPGNAGLRVPVKVERREGGTLRFGIEHGD